MKGERKASSDKIIRDISKKLDDRDLPFFSRLFRSSENWRLWEDFSENIVYLDIETTGTRRYSPITVVGAYNGKDFNALVRGKDLHSNDVKTLLSDATMLVTFNGASFDLPMIEWQFPGTVPSVPHLDLRFLAKKCGYSGGLKSLEVQMGLARPEDVKGMSGEDAVRLWHLYERESNRNALKLLLKYNMEDIVNLQPIAERLVKMMREKVME